MSNVKEVFIEGWMPFDANNNHELIYLLGQISLPSIGFKLSYSGKTKMIPQENGGQYCFYEFSITGQEAVSWTYLDNIMRILLENKCTINASRAKDIEGDNKWYKI